MHGPDYNGYDFVCFNHNIQLQETTVYFYFYFYHYYFLLYSP